MSDRFSIETSRGSLTAARHAPAAGGEARHAPVAGARTRIVATHGASGTLDTPSLRALGDALAERGVEFVRFNLPAAEAKRRSPDRAPVVQTVWREVAAAMRDGCERLVIGGRSYGGRMASNAAADDPGLCDGLLLLAYPLHPPGKPEQLRIEHLPRLTMPILVVQGDRDPFASGTLLDDAFDAVPKARIHRIAGGDHSHKVSGRTPAEIAAEVADATIAWLGS